MQSICKPCKSKDPAQVRASREYEQRARADPGRSAAKASQVKGWQQAHPDRMRELSREAVARWRAAKPDEARKQARCDAHIRRARRRLAPYEIFPESAVFERDGWTCQLCLGPIDPTLPRTHSMGASLDHRTPLSRGGTHTFDNVQASHLTCNHRKGTKVA